MSNFFLSEPVAKVSKTKKGGLVWGACESAKLRTLSLGGGIQSTTMALMAAHGEIGPMPDVALYAPVGDAQATRDHIRWLGSGNVLPFPVLEIQEPKTPLRQAIDNRAKQNGRHVSIPMFLDGKRAGQDRRQCTREYKVDRLNAAQRKLAGYHPRQRMPKAHVEVWIGFSTDEVYRAGPAHQQWAVNRFPLLEQRMNLGDCIAWLKRYGYDVPIRSKCTFCPYRSDDEWRWLRENEPDAWADAVSVDRTIRNLPGMRATGYLHRSFKPLDEIDFDGPDLQAEMEICEAGCGV